MPVFSEAQKAIVRHLAKVHPQLCTIEAIVEATGCSRNVATETIDFLIEARLAYRPFRGKVGAALTEDGWRLAAEIAD